MHSKEIDSTSTIAWGPANSKSTSFATGTLAGAMDASFSTDAELEVWDLNEKTGNAPIKVASYSSSSRFNRLTWSPFDKHGEDGVIIGGMEDGSLGFWKASNLLNGDSNGSLIEIKQAHSGPVKGLEANPFQPYLIASGSVQAQICLWDLNNLVESFTPSQNKSNRLEDITDLAWNKKVAHILATASNNGSTVIWDLKSRKEVMQLGMPGGRKSVSSIVWDPENPTHILTATDDDSDPVIYSWDLRNAHAPNMTLSGHSKGVLSMSWCPKDAELLLSAGKDNKTICWNPKTGEKINEVTNSANWIFDVQWCPRNPDLFSTASFDGKIKFHSFQALSSGSSATPVNVSVKNEDFFNSPQVPRPLETKATGTRQIPKWLKRPIGAAFGFGGRLVTFSDAQSRKIVISPLFADNTVSRASSYLDAAIHNNQFAEFCASKISHAILSLHEKDTDSVYWSVVKALIGQEPQRDLMALLGFDKEKLEKQIASLNLKPIIEQFPEEKAPSQVTSKPTSPLNFGDDAEGVGSVFDQLSLGQVEEPFVPKRRASIPFNLFGPESSSTDRVITQLVIMGQFAEAVDVCIKSGRISDALLVAVCGGPELVAKTQELYLQNSAKNPYLRVVAAIIKGDLTDVMASGDLGNWEELLGLVCSFAPKQDFAHLCDILRERLEEAANIHANFVLPAIICCMAAGKASHAANLILKVEGQAMATKAKSYEAYASWLEKTIEKVKAAEKAASLFSSSPNDDLSITVPGLNNIYVTYSMLMANLGHLDVAAGYFASIPKQSIPNDESDVISAFGNRLYHATKGLNVKNIQNIDPMIPINVVPEGQQGTALPETKQSQQPTSFSSFSQPSMPTAFVPGQQPQTFQPAPAPYGNFSQPISHPPPQQSFAQPTTMTESIPAETQSWAPPVAPAPYSSHMMPAPQPTMPQPSAPVAQPVAPPPTQFGWQPPAAPSPAMQPAALPPQPTSSYAATPASYQTPYSNPLGYQQQTSPTDMAAFPHGQRTPSITSLTAPVIPPPPPSIPTAGISFVGGVQGANFSTSQSALSPTSPTAPLPQIPPQPTLPPKPVGGFNDAPVIAPRAPLAPATTSAPITQPIAHPLPIQQQASTMPFNASAPATVHSPVPASAAVPPTATSPKTPTGPVDPSMIPSGSQPIYQIFSGLITFCQQRAMPVQRRILEDSVKRLQFLFHQLASNELSPAVMDSLHSMSGHISQRNFDAALELHVPLMTTYFAEVGQWILAAKRLIEVAKTCPQ